MFLCCLGKHEPRKHRYRFLRHSVHIVNLKVARLPVILLSIYICMVVICRVLCLYTLTLLVRHLTGKALGDFTFWISLFAQSKIRTERKLNQKVKSVFLFGLSPNFGLSERLS